ncbi:class I SAM-dependent methyltransferase [Novosphingobium acidiphilum]|uniref:class I SAM-dependent methyltransferase n=1 Tax=Novosphingobium acidiphilum TaxID=505248 RepID=UPI00048CB6A5|nr:class I SAM-dependent methyltransferase [Novosphingobium acidiphilum]
MSVGYYNENAQSYFDSTVLADMQALRNRFLQHVRSGGSVLDAGCGSGRDAKAFGDAGYLVTAFDASVELVRLASHHTGLSVHHMTFEQMDWQAQFDGIWASACLLHVARPDLPDTFGRFARALAAGGAWCLSMKQGDTTRELDGRTFTDVTEAEMHDLLEAVGLNVRDTWLTADVRPGRDDRWVNAIAIKP